MKEPRLSRKEARAERETLRKANEEAKRARLLARPEDGRVPRVGSDPGDGSRTPRAEKDPTSYFAMRMSWCVTRKDVDGSWSWGQQRQWTDDDFDRHIEPTLRNLTASTWSEISRMVSDGHRAHHAQAVDSLCAEAQSRWATLELATDEAFRFRLTGRQRAWGYRVGAHFHFVWYDAEHMIYPVGKSHT